MHAESNEGTYVRRNMVKSQGDNDLAIRRPHILQLAPVYSAVRFFHLYILYTYIEAFPPIYSAVTLAHYIWYDHLPLLKLFLSTRHTPIYSNCVSANVGMFEQSEMISILCSGMEGMGEMPQSLMVAIRS